MSTEDVVRRTPPGTDDDALPTDDTALLRALRDGDSEAFGELYARHYQVAYGSALRIVRATATAEDVVADSFTSLLAAVRAGGGPTTNVRAYLLTTVRRSALAAIRAGARTRPVGQEVLDQPHVDDVAVERAHEGAHVREAFAALPPRWRRALWYADVHDLTPAEVARMVGSTPNAVSSLLRRARERLRHEYLQNHLRSAEPGCAEHVRRYAAFVRGTLGPRSRAAVVEHLDGCDPCRAAVEELRDVNGRIRAVLLPLGLVGALHAWVPGAPGVLGPPGALGGSRTPGVAEVSGAPAAPGGSGASGASGAAGVPTAGSRFARSVAEVLRGHVVAITTAGTAALVGLAVVAALALVQASTSGTEQGPPGAGGPVPGSRGTQEAEGPPAPAAPGVPLPVDAPPSDDPPTGGSDDRFEGLDDADDGAAPPTDPAPGSRDGGDAAGGGDAGSDDPQGPAPAPGPPAPGSPAPGPPARPGTSEPPGTPGPPGGPGPSEPGPSEPGPPEPGAPEPGPGEPGPGEPGPSEPGPPEPPEPSLPVGLDVAVLPLGDLVRGRSGVVGVSVTNTEDRPSGALTATIDLPQGVVLDAAGGSGTSDGSGPSAGSGVSGGSGTAGDWTCEEKAGSASCTVPALAPGRTSHVLVPVVVDATAATGDAVLGVRVDEGGVPAAHHDGAVTVRPDGLAVRYVATGAVDVAVVGAPSLHCPVTSPRCAEVVAGTATGPYADNNVWQMVRLDEAGLGGTSSSARLEGTGDVLAARLYWSGTCPGEPGPVRLVAPDGTSSTAAAADVRRVGGAYQASADVTEAVRGGGYGRWTVADVCVTPGFGQWGGWSLVVVHAEQDRAEQDRAEGVEGEGPDGGPGGGDRLAVVLDGLVDVSAARPAAVTTAGLAGTSARVGVVAWEGDAATTGDRVTVSGSSPAPHRWDGTGPAGTGGVDNVLDSTAWGSSVANSLGVDAKELEPVRLDHPVVEVRATTGADSFFLGAVTVVSGYPAPADRPGG